MNAHVLAIDEDDARAESLVVDVDVILWQVLAQAVAHQGVGPIGTAGAQHEVVEFGPVAVVKQRVVQAAAAIATAEVDAEHFLGQLPAVLAVDLDAGALVEHRFVVAVIFKKLNVHGPLPIRFEILYVNARVRIPEIFGVGHQREDRQRPFA